MKINIYYNSEEDKITKIKIEIEENINDPKKKKKKEEEDFTTISCQNIFEFCNAFPTLIIEDKDLFKFEEEIDLKNSLNDYFKIIYDYIKNDEIFEDYDNEEKSSIKIQIENYVHAQIYYKIFIPSPSNLDLKIYFNCNNCSSIKAKLLNPNLEYLDEKFVQLMINFVNNIEKELCPNMKLHEFEKIEMIAENIGNLFGYDDKTCTDLIIYAFIKAKPYIIHSTFLYIKMYLSNGLINEQNKKKLNKFEQIIMQLSVLDENSSIKAKLGTSNDKKK